jgi:hypothetical protein
MLKKTIVFLFLGIFFNAVFAQSGVFLSLWPNKKTGPFMSVQMTGSAFKSPVKIRFDTAASTLIVPEGCVNQASVRVIVPHTKDEWGNPAALVSGQVTLTGKDGTLYTVNDLPFFMVLGKRCNSGFKNFGADMDVYFPSGTTSCAGNFFSYYNYPKGMSAGYTVNAHNMVATGKALLKIGVIAPGNYQYQLPYRSMTTCINNRPMPMCTGYQHWGSSIPNVNLEIDSVKIPQYEAMIDTGGGMVIIRDTPQATYTRGLGAVLTKCPSDYSFLENCKCLPAGHSIGVSVNNIHYHYVTSDIDVTQTSAVAICPNSTYNNPDSTNSYVFSYGVNLGFNFFNYNRTVSYNMQTCTIKVSY